MTQFKSLFILLLSVFSFTAQAQLGRITPEQFRQHFAKLYVDNFVYEFNGIKDFSDVKMAYGALFPKKLQRHLTNWSVRPHVRAEGTTIVVELKGAAPLRIEVVDLFKQQYKINGKKYARDFNANPLSEIQVLSRKIRGNRTALIDWLLPESEANPLVVGEAAVAAVVAVDTAEVIMAETAIAAGTQATTAGAMAAATGDAATVASTAAGGASAMARLEKLAEALTSEKTKEFVYADLIKRNEQLLGLLRETVGVAKNATETAREATAAATEAAKAATALAEQMAKNSVGKSWILGFLKGVQEKLFTVGIVVGGGTASAYAAGAHVSYITSIYCQFFNMGNPDDCAHAIRAAAPPPEAPLNPPKPNTCYNPKGVETSGYFDKQGGKKDVYFIHFGSPSTDGKSPPVSGLGFVVGPNGKVEADSIREFNVTLDKDLKFFVTGMKRVNLKPDVSFFQDELMTKPNDAIADKDTAIKDEVERLKKRDQALVDRTESTEAALSADKLREFHHNMDIIHAESSKEIRKELGKVAELTAAYQILTESCNHMKVDPKVVSAASAPGADTGINDTGTTK